MLPTILVLLTLSAACSGALHKSHRRATVTVKAFNVASITASMVPFFQPILPGHNNITVPVHAFLIEHESNGKRERVMFDLGVRADPHNLAPTVATLVKDGVYTIAPFGPITEQLEDSGVHLSSVSAVIWSHSHFDHTGDMSLWPQSTKLLIGPATNTSTYPQYPHAELLETDFAGREILKLNFNSTFSSLAAFDYFGDGSLVLIDTPGHHPGHITALARVTEKTFVLLGADACHHVGQLRPRSAFQKAYPCPAQLSQGVSTDFFWSPDSQLGDFDIASRSESLLSVADLPNSVHGDPPAARVSIDKLAKFDALEDVLVVLAHDQTLPGVLPYFPQSLNEWKRNGVKERLAWRFLEKPSPGFVFESIL